MPNITYHELSNYNNGRLVSHTFKLDGVSFEEHHAELAAWLKECPTVCGQPCEEWVVCDYEDVPSCFVGEYSISAEYWEYRDAIDASGLDGEVFEAGIKLDLPLDMIEELYQGYYWSDVDFVQQMLEDIGDIPDNLPCYIHIDWESTARGVMMDYDEEDGHYFRTSY